MKLIISSFYLIFFIIPIYLSDEIGWNVNNNKNPQNPGFGFSDIKPQNPGSNPQNPGYKPQNPGYNPQNPGYNPQNPGYNPQNPGYKPQNPGSNPQNPKVPVNKDTDGGSSMKKKLLGAGLLFIGGWAAKNILSDKNKDETKVCEGVHVYAPDLNTKGFVCPDNPQDMSRSECCYENNRGYCCANNKGKIFGGSFSTILILALLALLIFCICRRKRKQAAANNFEGEDLVQNNNPNQPNPNVYPNQPFPNQPYPNLPNQPYPEYA